MERHIQESEVYISTGELLYIVIAVYIITVLIKTIAGLESHYNLLVVSCYLDQAQQVSNIIYSRLKQYDDHIACSYLHVLFKDIECTLLPTICNYYYHTILFLCVEN